MRFEVGGLWLAVMIYLPHHRWNIKGGKEIISWPGRELQGVLFFLGMTDRILTLRFVDGFW